MDDLSKIAKGLCKNLGLTDYDGGDEQGFGGEDVPRPESFNKIMEALEGVRRLNAEASLDKDDYDDISALLTSVGIPDREPGVEPGSEAFLSLTSRVEIACKRLSDPGEPGPRCPKCGHHAPCLRRYYDDRLAIICAACSYEVPVNLGTIENLAQFFPAERQEALGTCNLNGNPHQKTCGCIDWMSL